MFKSQFSPFYFLCSLTPVISNSYTSNYQLLSCHLVNVIGVSFIFIDIITIHRFLLKELIIILSNEIRNLTFCTNSERSLGDMGTLGVVFDHLW